MKLTEKEIKSIAEDLSCGMICYVHRKTKEVKTIMDPDSIYIDESLWKEDLEEIENNREKYLKIDKMPSRDSFRIMDDFTDQVTDESIRNRLIYSLKRNKPFKNFKYELEYDEALRQQWFEFKSYRYEEWVKTYLQELNDQ